MQLRFLSVIVIILCLFGCSKKEEAPQMPSSTQQTASAPPEASAPRTEAAPQPESPAPQEQSQMYQVKTAQKNFKKSFVEAMGKGKDLAGLRARLEAADQAHSASLLLRPDIQDPAALDLLTRFSDKLKEYSEKGHVYLANLEEADKMLATINETKAGLAKVPEKDRDKATKELNAVITRYNNLYKDTLPKQRDELESLTKELMTLK